MPLTERQRLLAEEICYTDDRQERLMAVMDRVRERPPLPQEQCTAETRVRGCTSGVWIVGHVEAGICHLQSDADSPMVRGLVALLVDPANGAAAEELHGYDTQFLEDLGILRSLSGTRVAGLQAVAARIRQLALSGK